MTKKLPKPAKIALIVLISLVCVILAAGIIFTAVYFPYLGTAASVQKITDYQDGYNIYTIDIGYDYSTENIINSGFTDDAGFLKAVSAESVPFIPVSIDLPSFACSAFSMATADGGNLMGRNYDFRLDTSGLFVLCHPKNGYRSVGFCALDNLGADDADSSIRNRLECLASPFACLDGINEKGLSVAVLTVPSEPVHQNTGKPLITTTLLIRLVLDKAATTEEAVKLIEQYDMFSLNGRDNHFYITDASGDGRVLEYDCEDPGRRLVVTPVPAVTNFYEMYTDKVQSHQKNGIYGAGKERYEAIMEIMDANEGTATKDTAWAALKAAAQDPNPEDITSNTQWSIVYDNTNLTGEITLRRHWDDVYSFSINGWNK